MAQVKISAFFYAIFYRLSEDIFLRAIIDSINKKIFYFLVWKMKTS